MSFQSSLRATGWFVASILATDPILGAEALTHFEARQTHPLELGLDGRTLLGINSPEGRLAVFSVVEDGRDRPVLYEEIPVGLGPVSVRARTVDEVWVVNEVSDSISIVSLSARAVVATVSCPDEPADVAFAGDRAVVSSARNQQLHLFDAVSRRTLRVIPLDGRQPRSLAFDPQSQQIVVGFLNSGNGTTVLAPPTAPVPEAPWNPALGPAPATALIVDASDPRVKYTVLDHDVARVSLEAPEHIEYFGGLGTSIFGVFIRPGTDEVWVGNTEAHNQLRFEPRLKSRFVSNRITRLDLRRGEVSIHDLSPFDASGNALGIHGRDDALAQPMELVFAADGSAAWVAAFASDRVARLTGADGTVEQRVDLRAPGEGPARMRGPRGLAWNSGAGRLYVLNKLSATVSTVDTGAGRVVSEVPLGGVRALAAAAQAGQGLLFDARLSGNGASSCGSCHLDADVDGLAWDLGNPAGEVSFVTGANLAVHDPTPRDRAMHPMKGPMVTQTLRGLNPDQRLHWRGDRANLQEFNATFRDLLGGELRAPAEIDALAAYLSTLRHHPNPNRNPDNSLAESLNGGSAWRGEKLFAAHLHHCGVCHVLPRGTDFNVDDSRNLRLSQPVMTPSLRTTYQRAVLNTQAGATNLSGFGLLHDGTGSSAGLPTVHFYDLDALSGTQFQDVAAFVLSFDSGTAPVVGRSVTVDLVNRSGESTATELALLENQAAISNRADLVVHGRLGGRLVQLQFSPVPGRYESGSPGEGWHLADLLRALAPEDALTFLAVPPGMGGRYGLDREGDGVPDALAIPPSLTVRSEGPAGTRLEVPAVPGWVLESATDLAGPWIPRATPTAISLPHSAAASMELFRLRRTW